jgi:hypothetical protein
MNALPIVRTPTPFCTAELPLFGTYSFWLDGNGKITRENGTYREPRPNAFSLPAASVTSDYAHAAFARPCPGSTPTCRASCYVRGLAQNAPDVYDRYHQNLEALTLVLAERTGREFFLGALKLAGWIEEHARHGFRWHVSGDVLNVKHAEWIVTVCRLARGVPFWIYTRTLDAVPTLRRARNLAVNISADVDNYSAARACALTHSARLCYLSTGEVPDDLPPGSVIFPDYPIRLRSDPTWFDHLPRDLRAAVCPTDLYGQSEAHRCGPCRKCF